MVQYNGNDAFFSFDGVELQMFFMDEISHEATAETEDTTHGAGATHVMRETKLIDSSISFAVIHDKELLNTYKAVLQVGKKAVLVWGPEGNATGKPKLEGKYILTNVSTAMSVDKQKVGYELSFEQADKPVTMITGDLSTGVFS